MTRPLVAVTPWRRILPTLVHPESDLYTLGADYTDSIVRAGATPVILPWLPSTEGFVDPAESAAELVSRFDAVVLSGGSDVDPALYGHENTASYKPNRSADESDIAVACAALDADMPMLAICRGQQILNVACGGTLNQHIWGTSDQHPDPRRTEDRLANADAALAHRHPVHCGAGSIVADIFGSEAIDTNSLHHQSVDQVGDKLSVVGTTPDGVIEAIEHDSGRALGVQWHPERLGDEGHGALFDWLVGLI